MSCRMWVALIAVLACSAALARGKTPAAEPPAATTATTADHAPQRRIIALDAKRARGVYKVNAAPGLATVIELPELWTVHPACGDCVFGDAKAEGQLFRLDLFPETRTLSIKPTRLPGPDAPASAFITNIDVALEGGVAITLFIDLVLPEDADARVEFTLGDDDKIAAKLTKKERELEARFDDRVKTATADAVLGGLIPGTTCKDFFGRPNRSDNVVVRLRQICHDGAKTWLVFEVENRRHDDLFLSSARLDGSRHGAMTGAKLEKTTLHFNDRVRGVAAVHFEGDGPETFKLSVTEDQADGGKSEHVVDDISF